MSQQSQSFRTIFNVSTTLSANEASINLTNTRMNAVIGAGAASKNITGQENTIFGSQALYGNTIGSALVAFGCLSASNLQTGSGAVFVGNRVAPSLRTCSDSIFVGHAAGSNTLSAESCVVLGPNSGVGTPSQTLIDVVSVGSRCVSDGTGGTLIGSCSSASGDAFICIGYCNIHHAARGITVGTCCSNTCSDSIVIGNNLGYNTGGSNNLTIIAGHGTGRLNIQNILTGQPNTSNSAYDLQLATPSGSISLIAPTGVVASGGMSAQTFTTPSITISPPALSSPSILSSLVSKTSWNISLATPTPASGTDLLLESSNGTQVTFCDDFVPGVLNFTAQHRCALLHTSDVPLLPGSLVVTTGAYLGLDGSDLPSINESVPVVAPSQHARDPTVFGVVSCHEEIDPSQRRVFRVGSLGFSLPRHPDERLSRVVVNAGGEGGILVCDANGPIMNGDLLTSSDCIGLAMRQGDDLVRSSTIAKATCACDFKRSMTETGMCERGEKMGVLIGCVYL